MKQRGRYIWAAPALIAAALIFAGANISAGSDNSEYRFFPNLLKITGDRQVTVNDFTGPETCGACHQGIHEQWEGSMHANSFKDPVWQKKWKMAFEETGGAIGTECIGCHSPIGMMTDKLVAPADMEKLDNISANGVQCDYCHSIDSTHYQKTRALEPHNMAVAIDPGQLKRGPFGDSEASFHDSVYSQLHTSAEFCGNCHNVFHGSTGFPIERTYDEWRHSVYARNGIVCQDCHMAPIDNLPEVAATLKRVPNPGYASEIADERPHIYTHEFVGGNFVMSRLLGSEKHAVIAEKRLKAAARLSLSSAATSSPGLTVVDVKVENIAAGHNLPTSLTELRQMWLDVRAEDAAGKIFWRSGAVDEKGAIDSKAVIFNSLAVDDFGQPTLKPWKISHFAYNKTIPPKGYAVESFAFVIPADAKKPVTVRAELNYRSFDQAVADALFGDAAPRVPKIIMTAAELKLD
ncbi:MAG TPA: multiheme c-type cytochrome [bacterium]|nr:multiheme c-type cytochrome [bacterium]